MIALKKQGMRLYDSNEYLDDIYRFIVGEPLRWRERNHNVCDSPSLYFAIEPNGNINPCCDFKLGRSFPVYDPEFPEWYRSKVIHEEVYKYTRNCAGCMYGSYPEMTITARYLKPMLSRFVFFNTKTRNLLKKVDEKEVTELAQDIYHRNEQRRRRLGVKPVSIDQDEILNIATTEADSEATVEISDEE